MSDVFISMIEPPDELDGPALWLCVRNNDVWLETSDAGHDFPEASHAGELSLPVGGAHFLGVLSGRGVWAVDVHEEVEPHGFEPLMSLYGKVDEVLWTLAGRAVQIVEWDRTHRFCGRCGNETEPMKGERARRCPACGLLAFPRLSPAVIVLVERGDQCLLARNKNFPLPMYSTLAGFVEPGETVEQTVHREIREEVGIEVADLRWFGSQPWPFPNSLMLGFTATYAGGDLVLDPNEIADAGWFDVDDLPMIPPPMSIARRLIDDWIQRRRAAG